MPKNRIKILALLPFIFFMDSTLAEIYQWTDKNGKVHFSDKEPRHLESKKIELKINTYESVSYDSSIFDIGKKVVMYSTSWEL